MPIKTRNNKTRNNKTKKLNYKPSKRVLEMWKDTDSVWGKNKPLEKFWRGLASGDYVVLVYKNGKHKYVNLPNPNTEKSTILFNEFDSNSDITAVLSSNLSQDSYEIYLYPKAKDQSVDYVIKNYKKFFKSMGAPSKDRMEGSPLMKKVVVPL
uniref:Uncharacterized protein n=1 Tax=viral metagenome TaxID=1070528 RepID=A0A6C0AZ90_9ZZZZ